MAEKERPGVMDRISNSIATPFLAVSFMFGISIATIAIAAREPVRQGNTKENPKCKVPKPKIVARTSATNTEGEIGESFTMKFKVGRGCERKTLYVTCNQGTSKPLDCKFEDFDQPLR